MKGSNTAIPGQVKIPILQNLERIKYNNVSIMLSSVSYTVNTQCFFFFFTNITNTTSMNTNTITTNLATKAKADSLFSTDADGTLL